MLRLALPRLPRLGPVRRFHQSGSRRRRAQLTAKTYPALRRDERFAQLTDADVAHFRHELRGSNAVLEDDDDGSELAGYNRDWMGKYRGQSRLVLRPESTEEVRRILEYCHERRLAVVPQGGNTGLVGGSVPVFDEIVVSLARLQTIHSLDDTSGCLVLDAGVLLETADSYLAERGFIFPLDLGAKGSCQVGGNVATNAGGLRLLRYGSLHGSVLGMEAVMPDGTILDDLCTLRKNNTGYDIKQLLIGSEGTLGIITKLAVQCPPRPAAVNVAYLGLGSFTAARRAFREARSRLSEILSAFELMDRRSQQVVRAVRGADFRRPLEDDELPFYCLIETSGSDAAHDYEKLERFLEFVLSEGIVADGVVAQDATQAKALWNWREAIPECVGHWGGVYKYDVSIPMTDMYSLVEDVRARLIQQKLMAPESSQSSSPSSSSQDAFTVQAVIGYGHMGDANLHLNVAVRQYDRRVEEALEPFVYEWIGARRGSISAEHGLGLAKRDFIRYSRSETMVMLMKKIKELYDPKGIMNPYKYLK
ncbi:D-lactate dehydrogenase 2 [Ophiocordyceps camponoti-floridani]|uniref:D-lactate dehydrogenase (cytochrome) n=1 Tax=Ophiocordyceps camponoti-floridani TaxID=2030778 RepID=A0A8H4VCS8_9HYPO|nr:D-lactate dehydrogenase 2 [Ophiocordyceps camponoti-floridani]